MLGFIYAPPLVCLALIVIGVVVRFRLWSWKTRK